jgi:hypothetical protein
MISVRWVVRGYAAGCFLGCVGVHALTLSGRAIDRLTPLFWACFASVGLSSWVFLPAVRAWRSPAVVLALLVGLGIAYTGLYWWVMHAAGGGPVEWGTPTGEVGDRHLVNHGKWVRALTEEEYAREVLTQSRQWTACYAVFSLFALLLTTLAAKPDSPSEVDVDTPPPEPASDSTRS